MQLRGTARVMCRASEHKTVTLRQGLNADHYFDTESSSVTIRLPHPASGTQSNNNIVWKPNIPLWELELDPANCQCIMHQERLSLRAVCQLCCRLL